MNTTHTKIRLENSCPQTSLEVRALVDPGVLPLYLPTTVVRTLGLGGEGVRLVKSPDGTWQKCRYVGPVTLQCGTAQGFSGAVEFGDEVVLGSLPLGHLSLKLDPLTMRLTSVPVRV